MLLRLSFLVVQFALLFNSAFLKDNQSADNIKNLCSPKNSTRDFHYSTQTKAAHFYEIKSSPQDFVFSKWSNWSPCSRSCISKRHRRCKYPARCRAAVEQEEAFCFVKDSFCYKWLYEKVCEANYDDDEEYQDYYDYEVENSESEEDVYDEDLEPTCGVFQAKNSALTRIIGGHPSKKGHWPWQVAILNKYKRPFCGGTLINRAWVLSAAHCVRKTLYIRLGEHHLGREDGNELDTKVLKSVIHPDYDVDTVDNDLALLKIKETPTDQILACLPISDQKPPENQLCTIIGWGKKKASDLEGTEVLHQTEVYIMPDKKCREMYQNYLITENMFCAGHPSRRDSCAGDSGGPLLCSINSRWTIFGVTSFGEGCGKKGKFGVYTLVPNYINWIDQVINYVS